MTTKEQKEKKGQEEIKKLDPDDLEKVSGGIAGRVKGCPCASTAPTADATQTVTRLPPGDFR